MCYPQISFRRTSRYSLILQVNTMTQQTPSFTIHPLKLGPMDNFIYIIQDLSSNKAAIVDPAWAVSDIIAFVNAHHLHITDILLTHTHDDHMNGVYDLLKTYDVPVHLLQAEFDFWGKQSEAFVTHQDNDMLQLGQTHIKMLHTPGHTPGSVCYSLEEHLITGDTLFVSGCGRCDLRGGNPEQMYYSLQKLGHLPPETLIHPGHHYAEQLTATIAEEVANNPFMQYDTLTDFLQYRMGA